MVVGAGPNGLAAAVTLARAGRSVLVVEAQDTIGGGCRSAELTLPGVVHDVCSAIHPLASASPFFADIGLTRLGVELVHPAAPLAHPLDDGTAAVLERSTSATGATLGPDARAWRRLLDPLTARAGPLVDGILDVRRAPLHPAALARFGLRAAGSSVRLADRWFSGGHAPALLGGMAAHAVLPLDRLPTGAFGLMFATLGHAVGWPAARGGSQVIADALARHLRALGGEVVTGWRVDSVDELPPASAVLLDVAPRALLRLAGHRLPRRYRRALARFRHGPGVFKLDWALDGPIPWRAEGCHRAGTVHVGGPLRQVAAAEDAVWRDRVPDEPFVVLAQQSRFDDTRAPGGTHTGWAYCHVPPGCPVDMTDAIERQVERFAPGFRDRVLARAVAPPAEVERHNANCVGGDISGGVLDVAQAVARPAARLAPWTTPDRGLYLCSSSTPPGGGVHGMCGHLAARAALRRADW